MACFTVTAVEAVVVTAAAQIIAHKEKKAFENPIKLSNEGGEIANAQNEKMRFSRRLMWLAKLLWGGSFLLAFEHVWHGEVVPWFPFLTAAATPETTAEMLHEMATVGVSMAAIVTLVWAGIVIASAIIEKRSEKSEKAGSQA